MCGILGTISPETPVNAGALVRALATLRHRGPDDEGYAMLSPSTNRMDVFGGADTPESLRLRTLRPDDRSPSTVALAHRRLAILDLSEAGHQPMCDRSGNFWLIYNGEIYNYLELRAELERNNERFQTRTDSEVLLAAWRVWGPGALSKLVGMFAFGIVDLEARTLTLARDQLGIKPLYWTNNVQRFAFASEIKALLALPGLTASADAQELYRFLRFGCTEVDERSCFAGVSQLRPGHFMEVSLDTGKVANEQGYWRPGGVAVSNEDGVTLSEDLSNRLRESVRIHLRSDVVVGSCFSGGLDSSLIVAMAREQLGPTHRWTGVCFDNQMPGSSDAPYAESLATTLGLTLETICPSADEFSSDLDDLIYHQDVPFQSTSIYAQYAVFRRAKQCGLTVMLDGQGADELFGGYPTSLSAKVCEMLWRGDLAGVRALATSGSYPDSSTRRRILMAALGRMVPVSMTGPLLALIGEPLMPPEMNSSWFSQRGVEPRRRPEGRGRHALHDELQIQTDSWSLPHLLRYEDRNSMAFSIEARVPFCTASLADFASRAPSEQLISRNGVTKAVLRRVATSYLPPYVVDRAKIGFKTDESAWLLGAAKSMRNKLGPESFSGLALLNGDKARASVFQSLEGKKPVSALTWRLLMVAMWAQRFAVSFE